MQHAYIADQLMALSALLRTFDSVELQMAAMTLTNIGAEIRRHARPVAVASVASLLPEPPRTDPGSKVPRPKSPPRGSGPVRLKPAPIWDGMSVYQRGE